MSEIIDLKTEFLRKNGPFGELQIKDILMFCIHNQPYYGYYSWEFKFPGQLEIFKNYLLNNQYIINTIFGNNIHFSVPLSWWQ